MLRRLSSLPQCAARPWTNHLSLFFVRDLVTAVLVRAWKWLLISPMQHFCHLTSTALLWQLWHPDQLFALSTDLVPQHLSFSTNNFDQCNYSCKHVFEEITHYVVFSNLTISLHFTLLMCPVFWLCVLMQGKMLCYTVWINPKIECVLYMDHVKSCETNNSNITDTSQIN